MASPAIAAPTTEIGAPQHSSPFGPAILDDHEVNRDLAWPQNVRTTYPGMLNDAQAEGLYRGLVYPIHGYDWWLDENGAPQSAVDRISADYNLPVGPDEQINLRRSARRFIFDEHLEDALRGPALGHYPFEQVYELLQDGPTTINGGWVAHLRKLAPRPPATISEIRPARDGGLDFIRVPALDPGQSAMGVLGMVAGGGVKLPVDRLVMYVWDREGSNWAGRSMLRSCYRPWKLKDRVLRVGAINIERAGGVPYVEAPEGATTKQLAELHQLAASFRVGETAGAALPHGAQLKFAQAAGGDAAIQYVRLQNEEMARAWVQMINMLGQTETGSRALGQTFAQRASVVEERVATWFANVFNRHVIEDDVELNEGQAAEYAPLLRFTPAGGAVDALAGALDNAQTAGALPADSLAAAAVRAAAGERRPSSRPVRPRAVSASTTTAPVEVAHTDFEELQRRFRDAHAALATVWAGVQATHIDDLVSQIAAATSIAELAAIDATVSGATALQPALHDVLTHGAQSARDEATAQGATLPEPDLDPAVAHITAAATGTASLLAGALSMSARSRAVALAGENPDGVTIAPQVRDHLESLSGATVDYELAGLVTKAQNTGRFTAMRGAPDSARFYASAVNDANVCDPCAEEDGAEYTSIDELENDFPGLGGYVGCEGANRCRCTGVAVYAEAQPTT